MTLYSVLLSLGNGVLCTVVTGCRLCTGRIDFELEAKETLLSPSGWSAGRGWPTAASHKVCVPVRNPEFPPGLQSTGFLEGKANESSHCSFYPNNNQNLEIMFKNVMFHDKSFQLFPLRIRIPVISGVINVG